MADVFAVGLHAFALEDSSSAGPKDLSLSKNGSLHGATEIGAGPVGLLNLLSVIGTSLSIVGVVLAFITYSLFSDLRSLSGTSLLNLLAALFMSHLLSIIGVERTQDHSLCFTLSVLLHYLWLAIHAWLFTMSFDMRRTFRDNINLQPSLAGEDQKSFIGCALFAWGVPALCAGAAALIHSQTDWDSTPLVTETCWVVGKNSLLIAFIFPALFFALSDVYFFVQSAILVRYTASLQVNRRTRDKMKKRRYLQLVLYAKILTLLTITWTNGFLAQVTGHYAFWFAFVIFASTQGFFVSLFYSCNSQVFRLYSKSLRSGKSAKPVGYGSSELSRSTSLTMLTWQPTPDAV